MNEELQKQTLELLRQTVELLRLTIDELRRTQTVTYVPYTPIQSVPNGVTYYPPVSAGGVIPCDDPQTYPIQGKTTTGISFDGGKTICFKN